MPPLISPAAATAAGPYLRKRVVEQISQEEYHQSGIIAGAILAGILVPILLYYAATYVYGTIRYKVWVPRKVKKAEERDIKRRSTGTSVEVGEASQAYERQMKENLMQELSYAREWSWRRMMRGDLGMYPQVRIEAGVFRTFQEDIGMPLEARFTSAHLPLDPDYR